MSSSFSSAEAQGIIANARAALKTIDKIIDEQERYAKEIAELYGQLVNQNGNRLTRSISLIRIGPGKYRTLAGGKKSGTKSNLYLAAKSGADATIQTCSGEYDARACYERALDVAGIDEFSDVFEDLVFVGYKKWLHGEIIEKPLAEWKAMRPVIAKAIEAAEPALQGGLTRLFMNSATKQAAFDALDKLQKMDVARIATHMDYWPEFSADRFSSKEALVYCFRHDEEDRGNILGCLQKEIDGFKMESADARPFSSEEAQQLLDRFQGIADVPAPIAAAQEDVKNRISSAIDEMRESDVLAQLALTPIDELAKQRTGVQIKKLRDAGVITLADLYERMSSPEKSDLPGVGPKTLDAIEAYLNPIVGGIRKRWRLKLAADDKTDAAMLLLRTVQAYLELGSLHDRAQKALAGLKLLNDTQLEALRYAADPVDWLLADDGQVRAAGYAMEAANKQLEGEDGAWLVSMLDGSKVQRLASNLASISEARKAFRAHPDAFMDVIREIEPEVLASAEPVVADATPAEAPAPARQPKRKTTAKKPQHPMPAKTDADLLEQTKAFYKKFEGSTIMFLLAEDAPVFDAASKYSVSADAPRAEGDIFSCAIPDGWTSEKDTGGRAFVLVPGDHAGEGLESDIAILYGKTPVGEDYASNVQQYGMAPVLWAFCYAGRSYSANFTTEMHEVTARNCRCAVVQVPTADESCFEFYVYPYSLFGQDYLRITFYEPGDITFEQARTFVDSLARTVEIDGPVTPAFLERFEERAAEASSLKEIDEVISPVLVALTALCQQAFDAALRFYVSRVGEEAVVNDGAARACICGFDQYCDACVPLVGRIVTLLDTWIGLHPLDAEELGYCSNMLGSLSASAAVRPDAFADIKRTNPEFYGEIVPLCTPTPKQQVLLDRIDGLRASLGLPANESVADEQDGSTAPQESEPAPAQEESTDLVTFLLTFLSRGWFFFGGDVFSSDDGISWDGSQHNINDLKIDATSLREMRQAIQEIDAGFEDEQEVANYLTAFLNELEKDKGLRIPRKRIARGVQKALPKGPLTGMTLANLCESSRGLTFKGGFDKYQVFFDTRLSQGIPHFFNLVARLLWDLRGCLKSLDGQPFDIMFLATRSFDADPYLGTVNEPVEGAQECPMLMHVTDKPEISLS